MNTANLSLRFCAVLTMSLGMSGFLFGNEKNVEFNRDVRPILSEKCFHCHGFDEKHRQAELRLDTPDGALADLGGHSAIVPNDLAKSELVRRIDHEDPETRMPPESSHKSLSDDEKAILRRWIEQGAKYDQHWAFRQPAKPKLEPEGNALAGKSPSHSRWNSNPVDVLVRRMMTTKGLEPSPRTSPEKWLRRTSLDLTGLAPTPAETDRFLQDVAMRGESAFEHAVDDLLNTPRYGERMAQDWLDAARYADTHGFNNDTERIMWRWRDWVIDAYNSNMPYDQFITKQLAGDLLPGATDADRVATGYCRNHVINSEGGIIDEEYRVEYVVDRVRTLGTSVLGLTLECSRCHDHKYDPLTQRDFYQLYAFFNQVDEVGEDGRDRNAFPLMKSPTQSQERSLAEIDQRIEAISSQLNATIDESIAKIAEFKVGQSPERKPDESPVAASIKLHATGSLTITEKRFGTAYSLKDANSSLELELPSDSNSISKPWSFSAWVKWNGQAMPVLSSLSLQVDPSAQGYGRGLAIEIGANGEIEIKQGVRLPAYALRVVSAPVVPKEDWTHLCVTFDGSKSADGLELYVNGQAIPLDIQADGYDTRDALTHPAKPRLASEYGKSPRWSSSPIASPKWYTAKLVPSSWKDEFELQRLAELTSIKELSKEQARELASLHLRTASSTGYNNAFREAWKKRDALSQDRKQVKRSIPTAMVMRESAMPRDTFVLYRGRYDAPREKVVPDVPSALSLPLAVNMPRNRLGLAQWLTQPNHPLTSRVAVNRFWQQLFGIGLVKTSEDFGVQGEYPSNPELLDWLAVEFVESGWNVKGLLKSIVLSEAYRQESRIPSTLREIDPDNRLLARGPRVRLPAESVRDHLLQLGGLLKHRVGGPSVFPLQPDELYKGIVVDAPYAGTKWVASQGDDLYRRSVYTFWKRTVPFPVMTLFDAPDREFCVARRMNTNTPLQALTLMNEPALLESARGMARNLIDIDSDRNAASRPKAFSYGFRSATGRNASDKENEMLERSFNLLYASFRDDPKAAMEMITDKIEPSDAPYCAAWVAVASMILNLDETITKD